MDDLSGLLVEGFGLRPRNRAPMAASKARATASRAPSTSASVPPPPKAANPAPSWIPSPDYDLDTVFGAPAPARPPSVLDDDLFGGFSASSPPSAHADDDIFGSFASAPANYDHAGAGGDLLGDFDGGSGGKGMNSGGDPARGGSGSLDELIPGFGGSSPPRISEVYHNRSSGYAKSTEKMSKDSFIDLDSTVSTSHSSGSFVNAFEELDILSGSVKSDRTSTAGVDDSSIFDEFQKPESLFSSTVKKNRKPSRTEDNKNNMRPAGLNGFHGSSVIDDFMFTEPKVASDPLLDLLTKPPHSTRPTDANRVYASPMKSDQPQRNSMKHVESADDIWFSVSESSVKQSSVPPANIRKATSSPNILDDWNSLFGAPPSGEFQEIEGEPEERRKARLERHRRTLERAAKALGEKNERDIQMEREHAERHRISEGLDIGIKRWAAGKEGNLRALLSSLQDVLWPECGWQPVSLTDIITSASVKKVYRKATLCVHPDKVQQKGANLQQKYTAEKVFDLLKEAWKKFTVEELS